MGVLGINHVTFSVRDVPRSISFYADVLGFQLVARWQRGAYLLAGDLWVALVADADVRTGALPEYTHIAFSVSLDELGSMSARIVASGAPMWQENWTEGDSLYFLDPDGHKLELHSSDLDARLRSARDDPWEGLELLWEE